MKKILMATLIVLTVASTQAANIKWDSGDVFAPNLATIYRIDDDYVGALKGSSLISSTGYTLVLTFYGDNLGTTTLYTKSFTVNDEGAFYGTTSSSDYAFGNSPANYYWGSIVITSSDGWVLDYGIQAVNMKGTGDNEFYFITGTSNNWIKYDPIPEPATMALLGIGIVALGLRRRCK